MSLVRLVSGRLGSSWEVCVGLEVHAQVASTAKLFSRASAAYNPSAAPNTQVALFDASIPGTLPRVNPACVASAVATGLALKGEVNPVSVFERKHYMYADLPHGYQITQREAPIVSGGSLLIDVPLRNAKGKKLRETKRREVTIDRIQLEIDSGKSHHTLHRQYSCVDLNRAGVALMEIVTTPSMRSADEAGAFLRKLQAVLRHIGTCDGNMEDGSMRCDVNVSVRRHLPEDGAGTALGERVEMKNLNSIRSVIGAIEYETSRQIEAIETSGDDRIISMETRSWDAAKSTTARMRRKEDAVDYRFMPEPNLPPLMLDTSFIAHVHGCMPELLDDIQHRYMQPMSEGGYGLSEYEAQVIVSAPAAPQYFDGVAQGRNPKLAAKWVTNELFGHLQRMNLGLTDCPIAPAAFGALLDLVDAGTISGKIGKQVLQMMLDGDAREPAAIVEAEGWSQTTDALQVEELVAEVLSQAHLAETVAEAAGGRTRKVGFLVGQVIKASGGRANPSMVRDAVAAFLAKVKT